MTAFLLTQLLAADAPPPTLAESIPKLFALRDAVKAADESPHPRLEALAADLLERHPGEAERAWIRGTLAQVYRQADTRRHAALIETYAALALAHEKDSSRRARLWLTRGDATLEGGKPFAEARAAAAEQWLRGYKEVLDLRLPAAAPVIIPRARPGDPGEEAMIAQHLEQLEAKRKLSFAGIRDELAEQFVRKLADAYSRRPIADAEIRKAATRHLADATAVDFLVGRVIQK